MDRGRPSLFPFARESEFDSAWTTGMHQGEKYKNRHERRWFAPIVDAAGTHGFRRHDPGHTFASRLALAGVDLRTVHELLGHRSWEATCPTPTWLPNHQMATVERLVSSQGPPRVKQLTPKPAPAYQDREAVDPQIYDKSNRMNGAEAGIRYV